MGFARSASLPATAVLAGVALTVQVEEWALRSLDGPHYVRVRQAEYVPFTWFIGVVAVVTFAAVATLAIRERGTNPPALVALGLLVVMVVVTALVNGPINVQELGWNPQAPPADWAAIRDRWQVAHAVRTVACLGALAFLMSAVRGGGAAARP